MGMGRRHRFDDVERFCFFVGYPRSGHSLVGSLLNAHPEMVIAHELDAVGHFRLHFGRTQVYALLLERDEQFGSRGRLGSGYDYIVPNQFQGTTTRLRVIGDKRGQKSTFWLGRYPHVLDRIRRVTGVPIRVIHVTRNPYDTIATMTALALRERGVSDAVGATPVPLLNSIIDRYEQLCRWVAAIRPRLAADEWHDLAYEQFVSDPRTALGALCRFLDVEPGDAYLTDCAGVVWPSTGPTRHKITWGETERGRVERMIAAYPALAGYTWDD